MAIDWLEWKAKNTEQHIRHQGNDSEKLIGMKRLPVDGFCRDTNTVYEFQGCLWHGHRCWRTKEYNGVNPVNGKSFRRLVPVYAGQDTISQRPRLQRRGDVGMPVTSQ
jgi:hypothetical protein